MEFLFLVLRVALIGVFSTAALTKLGDGDRVGIHDILQEVGVSARVRRLVGIALPWVEMAIVVLLVIPATASVGAAAAALLLATMTLVVAIVLVRGKKLACNCFGQANAGPIGRETLIRNVALTAGALLLAAFGPDGAVSQRAASALPFSDIQENPMLLTALFGLFTSVLWLLFHQFRQNGRLLLRMDAIELRLQGAGIAHLTSDEQIPAGLPVGTLAPDFAIPRLDGNGTTSLRDLRAAKLPVVLVFSDEACAPCKELLPKLATWQREYASELTVALIVHDQANRLRADPGGYPGISLVQATREIAGLYLASATPSAVLVDANGTIQSALALGAQQIGILVEQARGAAPSAGSMPEKRAAFA